MLAGNTVHFGNLALKPTVSTEHTNLINLRFSYSTSTITMATFSTTLLNIVFLSTCIEVIRVAARRIVAGVANLQLGITIGNNKGDAMREIC